MIARKIGVLASVLFLSLSFSSTILASPTYSFSDLGVSSGSYLTFNAQGQINPTPVAPTGSIRPQDGPYSFYNENSSTALGTNDGPVRAFAIVMGRVAPVEVMPFNTTPLLEQTRGTAVNSKGTFVGFTATAYSDGLSFGQAISFTFSGGTQIVATPNHGDAAAFSINDAGLIVGTSGNRAFLTEGNTSWDLNTLIPSNPQFLLTSATDINNSGQILGLATDLTDNTEHYFLLTPTATPEPSSVLFFGAGIMITGWRFRKRAVQKGIRCPFKRIAIL